MSQANLCQLGRQIFRRATKLEVETKRDVPFDGRRICVAAIVAHFPADLIYFAGTGLTLAQALEELERRLRAEVARLPS